MNYAFTQNIAYCYTYKSLVFSLCTLLHEIYYICIVIYTQQHKLRTAYSTNDCRGKWTVIYQICILIYLALITQ